MMNRDQRKKQLIAQGALHRTDILLARHQLNDSLQPETLARRALQRIGLAAVAAVKGRNVLSGVGIDIKTMLPLAMTAMSLLAKRKTLLKTLLRGAAVSGTVAAVVALLSRKKKRRSAADAA